MTKRACNCRNCRARRDRAFWAIIVSSYTTTELEQFYNSGMNAKLVMAKAAA